MRRKILWCVTLYFLASAVLVGRLFVLCATARHVPRQSPGRWQSGLVASSELEHLNWVRTDDARGRIRYRNGQPWSGVRQGAALGQGDGTASGVRVSIHREQGATNGIDDPVVGQVGLPDVWPSARAVPEQGRSGLEAVFDDMLTGRRPGYAGAIEDVHGRVYPSVYALSPVAGADIRTTVDAAWQSAAQRALRAARVKEGAVVVLDVRTGDVLALASHDVAAPWRNTAVQAQTPGSVFKLVTLAAALESYRFRLNSPFTCLGWVRHAGVRMRCWTTHGPETLAQALAQSCDVAFAEVGMTVGRQAISRIAERLQLNTPGLQQRDGQPVLPAVEAGRVFTQPGNDAGLLANTAIGQEDVRLSPLAIANLAATVARGGMVRPARLVRDAERDGAVVRVFDPARPRRALTDATAARVGYAMRLAVTLPTGTAHWLAKSSMQPAVKTGTAEVESGQVNAWVVGFAPYHQPRIAFCVFVGHAPTTPAHQEARELVQAISQSYTQFLPNPVIP